jgi:hypothetical protein
MGQDKGAAWREKRRKERGRLYMRGRIEWFQKKRKEKRKKKIGQNSTGM